MQLAARPSAKAAAPPTAAAQRGAKQAAIEKPPAVKPALAGKVTQAAPRAKTSKEAPENLPPPVPAPAKPARKRVKEAAGVQSEAVARRTGKSWDDWFDVLDAAGGEKLDQRGVVAVLAQKHGIGPWWQQMIAVGYEEVRGKRDKLAPK